MSVLLPGPRYDEWAGVRPRLVFLDVDGTITANGLDVAPTLAAARRELPAAGAALGCATGRSWQLTEKFDEVLEYDGPLVLQNGAELWEDGAVVRRWRLGAAATTRVREWADAAGVTIEAFTDTDWFVSSLAQFETEFLAHLAANAGRMPEPFPEREVDAVKATAITVTPDQARTSAEAILAMGLECEAHSVPSEHGHYYLNITSPDATKGNAITEAAERGGFDLAGVMVVGDGPNDISMFDVAGTAVAMGQAIDAVRARAHFIAPDIWSDGAAAAVLFAART